MKKSLLTKGNVTVKTEDYGGFEKVGTFLAAGKGKTDIVLSLK